MPDIKDPRLLWAKGAMFLFLGMLAGWLIWIKNRDWETILLLAVFAWAFSRAYYFAFYVIEKYADPTFRYAGLLSLLGYIRAKALGLPYEGSQDRLPTAEPAMLRSESSSNSSSESPQSTQSPQPTLTAATNSSATTWRKVIYEGVWWLIVVNLANIAAPSIYSRLFWRNRSSEWLSDIVFTSMMGGFCAQFAVIGLLAGLIRRPIKWTLPFALLISISCTMMVCVGTYIVDGAHGGEPIVVALIGAVSGLLAVFTPFFAFKAASGIGCDVVESNESEPSSQSGQINQISIKYILIATTIIGLLVAIGKSLDFSDTFRNLGSEELAFGVLSLVVPDPIRAFLRGCGRLAMPSHNEQSSKGKMVGLVGIDDGCGIGHDAASIWRYSATNTQQRLSRYRGRSDGSFVHFFLLLSHRFNPGQLSPRWPTTDKKAPIKRGDCNVCGTRLATLRRISQPVIGETCTRWRVRTLWLPAICEKCRFSSSFFHCYLDQ